MTGENKGLGWQPDVPDRRDRIFAGVSTEAVFPKKSSLKSLCPPVFDQGPLGSCTAFATASAFMVIQRAQKIRMNNLSELFLYYYARTFIGTENYDSGAMIRDAVKSLNKVGVPLEKFWPYNLPKFTIAPPQEAIENAALSHHRAVEYRRLDRNLQSWKLAIIQNLPIIFGFSVYDSFYGNWKEVAPIPAPSENLAGGHAVVAVGYDDSKQAFLVRNSWGCSWKLKGYFYLPYEFIRDPNLSDDFWVITRTGEKASR